MTISATTITIKDVGTDVSLWDEHRGCDDDNLVNDLLSYLNYVLHIFVSKLRNRIKQIMAVCCVLTQTHTNAHTHRYTDTRACYSMYYFPVGHCQAGATVQVRTTFCSALQVIVSHVTKSHQTLFMCMCCEMAFQSGTLNKGNFVYLWNFYS